MDNFKFQIGDIVQHRIQDCLAAERNLYKEIRYVVVAQISERWADGPAVRSYRCRGVCADGARVCNPSTGETKQDWYEHELVPSRPFGEEKGGDANDASPECISSPNGE